VTAIGHNDKLQRHAVGVDGQDLRGEPGSNVAKVSSAGSNPRSASPVQLRRFYGLWAAPSTGMDAGLPLMPLDTSSRVVDASEMRDWAMGHGIWSSRVNKWNGQRMPGKWGIAKFFESAVAFEWMLFALAMACYIMLHLHLFEWPSKNHYHAIALVIWVLAAGAYGSLIWQHLGPSKGSDWLVGYFLEFVFSIENVFIYHTVVEAFQVPRKPAQKALFIVVLCQIVFQMIFFMGLASWLNSLVFLPYVLGAWLLYVGLHSARESEHGSFNFEESSVFKACRWVLGDKLLPGYKEDAVMFTEDERTRATLLLPALACLLMIDFIMEVDVTLTKIQETGNHYIAFTSSAAAAFAVPELFFVARDLFQRFPLMKYGVSFVLFFFGTELLLHNIVHIPDVLGVLIIAGVMLGCIILSKVLGYKPSHANHPDDVAARESPSGKEAAALAGPNANDGSNAPQLRENEDVPFEACGEVARKAEKKESAPDIANG